MAVDMGGDAVVLGMLRIGMLRVEHRDGEEVFRPGELFLADYGRRMRMQWTPHDFVGLVLPRARVEAVIGMAAFAARSVHRLPEPGLPRPLQAQLGLIWSAGREFGDADWRLVLAATGGLAEAVLQRCLGTVATAAPGLAPREMEVLALLRQGLTSKEIASRLGIASGTVRAYRRSIYAKLDVTSRGAAIATSRDAFGLHGAR
jgi:DNA-binding CsgD family transcriptional regulator